MTVSESPSCGVRKGCSVRNTVPFSSPGWLGGRHFLFVRSTETNGLLTALAWWWAIFCHWKQVIFVPQLWFILIRKTKIISRECKMNKINTSSMGHHVPHARPNRTSNSSVLVNLSYIWVSSIYHLPEMKRGLTKEFLSIKMVMIICGHNIESIDRVQGDLTLIQILLPK